MKRKVLSMLLCATLASGMLAGCGVSNSAEIKSDTPATTRQQQKKQVQQQQKFWRMKQQMM